MSYISERIINLCDLEKRISDVRSTSNQLIKSLKNEEISKATEHAKVINKSLADLDDFEFIIEHRKISRNED